MFRFARQSFLVALVLSGLLVGGFASLLLLEVESNEPSGSRLSLDTLEAGIHWIDNPVVVGGAGLVLDGRHEITLRPLNPGRPMLIVNADGVAIRGLSLVGLAAGGVPSAAIGIRLESGTSRCMILSNRIRGVVGSAILGDDVETCTLVGNRVSGAGGDGFRLRGGRFTILENSFDRVFDEPLDVAANESAVVMGNRMSRSRIGMAITAPSPVVASNLVDSQVVEGIAVYGRDGGVVVGNEVIDGGGVGLKLSKVRLVQSNRVHGKQRIGLVGEHMAGGIFSGNHVEGDSVTFSFVPDPEVPDLEDGLRSPADSLGKHGGAVRQSATAGPRRPGARTDDPGIFVLPFEVSAPEDDERLAQAARRISSLLSNYNPGILTVDIREDRMQSEITRALAEALGRSSSDIIDALRAPMRSYWSPGSPPWILTRGGRPVFRVTRWPTGPGVRVSPLDARGETGFWESVVLRFHHLWPFYE